MNQNIGLNWDDIENGQAGQEGTLRPNYEEVHRKRKKIIGEIGEIQEDVQRAKISSDGEAGRVETESESSIFKLNCGCLVDSIDKVRKTPAGHLVCAEKHFFRCDFCGNICEPGEEFLFNDLKKDRTMHRHCAYKYIGDLRVAIATGQMAADVHDYVALKRIHRILGDQLH